MYLKAVLAGLLFYLYSSIMKILILAYTAQLLNLIIFQDET